MLYFILSALVKSEVIEITKKEEISDHSIILVKFYQPSCPHCAEMAPEFEAVSKYFDSKYIKFGGIDCEERKPLCKELKVEEYPTVKLYKGSIENPIEFSDDNDRTAELFADFIEKNTELKGKRPPSNLVELNPTSFKAYREEKCLFTTFYTPWCAHCKKFLPVAKKVANNFAPDVNVSVGTVNCEKYRSLCNELSVKGFPTVKLLKGEQVVHFEGTRTLEHVTDFINEHCGTSRGYDGILNDRAGLIEEVQKLIPAFHVATDKEKVIEDVKKIKGSDFYVKALQRYVDKGVEQIRKDMAIMKAQFEAKKAAINVLDGMKMRYNVLAQLLPLEQKEDEANTEDEKSGYSSLSNDSQGADKDGSKSDL